MDNNNREPPGLDFFVHGTPKGKGRPRFTRDFYGGVHTHTPAATASFEQRVRDYYFETYPRLERPVYGKGRALVLEAEICFSPPASLSKKKQVAMVTGKVQHTKKPDIDNVLKAITDALNNVAYADDAQIIKMVGEKHYDAIEGVRVKIHPA